MFFIFVLSLGAPGVVPSKTNETNREKSELQKFREEIDILYQVKYDTIKALNNCSNYLQYYIDSTDKAQSIQKEFYDSLEETRTKLSKCENMLDTKANEVQENRFYANAYEKLYEETNEKELQVSSTLDETRLVLESYMKQNNKQELEKCEIRVNNLQNELQDQLSLCELETSKLEKKINDAKHENEDLFDMWWQNEIVCDIFFTSIVLNTTLIFF